jgi:hypothetical protein
MNFPKNMLRIASGEDYNLWPFEHLVEHHRASGAVIAPNANKVMKDPQSADRRDDEPVVASHPTERHGLRCAFASFANGMGIAPFDPNAERVEMISVDKAAVHFGICVG